MEENKKVIDAASEEELVELMKKLYVNVPSLELYTINF